MIEICLYKDDSDLFGDGDCLLHLCDDCATMLGGMDWIEVVDDLAFCDNCGCSNDSSVETGENTMIICECCNEVTAPAGQWTMINGEDRPMADVCDSCDELVAMHVKTLIALSEAGIVSIEGMHEQINVYFAARRKYPKNEHAYTIMIVALCAAIVYVETGESTQ